MLKTRIQSFFNPERFQGWNKASKYFEGWYFKIINADETAALAVIPGIAMDRKGNKHAFIQVLDGLKKTADYHKFRFDDFKPSKNSFQISIADNHFSEKSLKLNLPELNASLEFEGLVAWPKPWYSPGIMGPYAFAPFMECYHGIVSMDHSIKGQIGLDRKVIDFENGRGYIEKDWGQSFPSAYVWMQSNHFSNPGISIKASVATIPWIGNSFVGFIAGVWVYDKLYRFTTYNRTRMKNLKIDSKKVELVLENTKLRLEILAKRDEATSLASPIRGFMEGRIEESMTALLHVNLIDIKNKKLILSDNGRNAGLEVAGKIEKIIF